MTDPLAMCMCVVCSEQATEDMLNANEYRTSAAGCCFERIGAVVCTVCVDMRSKDQSLCLIVQVAGRIGMRCWSFPRRAYSSQEVVRCRSTCTFGQVPAAAAWFVQFHA